MERCLITGAGGFVGRYLLEYFNKTDDAPRAVLGVDSRVSDVFDAFGVSGNSPAITRLTCRFESIDLMNQQQFAASVAEFQPDCLIHLAAMSSVAASWQDPAGCLSKNTGILINVCESVKKHVPRCRILAIGSSEVYGSAADTFVTLDETQPLRPANPYAVSRLAQENLIQIYTNVYGLDIVSTRSFSHTGPRQHQQFVVPSFLQQLLEAKQHEIKNKSKIITLKTGHVDLIRDFSDVRDVVRAYHLLLKHGQTGQIYNVCRGEGISLRNIIESASRILEVETAVEVDPARLRPADSARVVGNPEKLRRETGWNPQFSLEQTLRDMCSYQQSVAGK
jgi:GDP-4-dehydro-6-deoxy-D-mannose reductase